MIDVLAGTLVLAGAALAVLTGLALLSFDDVLSRLHGATKIGSLGLLAIVTGAILRLPDAGSITKLLLAASFQLLTAPVLSHVVARAAVRNRDMHPDTQEIDLAATDPGGSDGGEQP